MYNEKKKRAGRFANRMENQEFDEIKLFEWLKRGILNYDRERIILAAQDEVLLTNGLNKISKLTDDGRYWFCQESVETVNHLLSGCPKLLAEVGTRRDTTTSAELSNEGCISSMDSRLTMYLGSIRPSLSSRIKKQRSHTMHQSQRQDT